MDYEMEELNEQLSNMTNTSMRIAFMNTLVEANKVDLEYLNSIPLNYEYTRNHLERQINRRRKKIFEIECEIERELKPKSRRRPRRP